MFKYLLPFVLVLVACGDKEGDDTAADTADTAE